VLSASEIIFVLSHLGSIRINWYSVTFVQLSSQAPHVFVGSGSVFNSVHFLYGLAPRRKVMAVELIDIVIRALLVLATGFLFGIIFVAYLRVKSRKLLLISIGFLIFFIQYIATIPELFFNFAINENLHLSLHLIALVFILIGILKD
jgi:hypothetical protein